MISRALMAANSSRSQNGSAVIPRAFFAWLLGVNVALGQGDLAEIAARAERGGPDATALSLQVLSYGSELLVTETSQIADVPEFAIRTATRVARVLPSYNAVDIVTTLNPSQCVPQGH
jgi:hypothetical protein